MITRISAYVKGVLRGMQSEVGMIRYYVIQSLVLFILALNSFCDIRRHEICPRITIGGGLIGFICAYLWRSGLSIDFLASTFPGICFLMMSLLTKGAVGAGDGFVLLALSGYLSLTDILSITAFGLLLSSAYAGLLLIKDRCGMRSFAFVPFLLGGYVLHMLTELAR